MDTLDNNVVSIKRVKEKLNNHVGKVVELNYSLGRNKFESYDVKIKELYNNIFIVELINDYKCIKSFSYTDILTNTVKIKF